MHKQLIPAILGISIITPLIQPSVARAIASSAQVSNIAQQVTVSIETKSGHGSGVLIQHTGGTYTILTAAHVVNDRRNPALKIITPDLQIYPIDPTNIKVSSDRVDLATVSFESPQNYQIAELGDSNTVARGQNIFAVGFLGKTLQFHPGKVVAIGRQPQESGYSLAIGSADILPGMSGGGLLNESGQLVGIGGKSIGTIDPKTMRNGITNPAKPVSGLAIPINTFTQIASQLQVNLEQKPVTAIASGPTADDFFVTAQNKSQKGDYQGAIADYDRTLALNPNFGEVYFRRGLARNILKDWQGANIDYSHALEVKPDHAEAYTNRGLVRSILADWQGARTDFNYAIMLNPNLAFAYVGRGTARCELKDCQGSITDYDRAIALNPTEVDAYTSRGLAHSKLGNKQSAIADYIAAAELYRRQGQDRQYLETVQKIRVLKG